MLGGECHPALLGCCQRLHQCYPVAAWPARPDGPLGWPTGHGGTSQRPHASNATTILLPPAQIHGGTTGPAAGTGSVGIGRMIGSQESRVKPMRSILTGCKHLIGQFP